MNTYIKNTLNGTIAAVRASPVYLSLVAPVKSGEWEIVKGTPALRADATVKKYRILDDGQLGLI